MLHCMHSSSFRRSGHSGGRVHRRSWRVRLNCSHCPFPSGWYGELRGFLNTIHLAQVLGHFSLKTSALISMNSLRNTIDEEPFMYKGFDYGAGSLVPSGYCYGEFSEYIG